MNSDIQFGDRASSSRSKHEENPRLPYATGSAGLAPLVRGSSRRIMIMRFRPANIRLINRRSNLLRLLLALSLKVETYNDKNNPTDVQWLTGSLHIREPLRRFLISSPRNRRG